MVKASSGEVIDLGFFIKVDSILEYADPKPRNYATSKLISRMKIRQANADISDLASDIKSAIVAKKPHYVYSIFTDEIKNKFIEDNIFGQNTPDQIEQIVEQYFKKIGADMVDILPKNHPENHLDLMPMSQPNLLT